MSQKLPFSGKVSEQGILTITNRKLFDKDLLCFAGKEITGTIERKKKKRSSPQNRYYHACIVPICKEILKEYGYLFTNENTHEFLKANFNTKELVNEKTGEVRYVPMTTTTLSTIEFEEYLERIRIWAFEFAQVTIELPNTQTSIEV